MAVKSTIGKWAASQRQIMNEVENNIAGVILTRSTMLAPRLSGDLQSDGRVEKTNSGHSVIFGSSKVPYARRRHFENKKNPQTLGYLAKGGDSVAKENVKKYVDMSV